MKEKRLNPECLGFLEFCDVLSKKHAVSCSVARLLAQLLFFVQTTESTLEILRSLVSTVCAVSSHRGLPNRASS